MDGSVLPMLAIKGVTAVWTTVTAASDMHQHCINSANLQDLIEV
jgi:hypothetical protein